MVSDIANDEEIVRLVSDIARGLVDEADAIRVELLSGETARIVHLSVGPNDFGKILGKQGNTAKSIRTILAAASNRLHRRYTLELVEHSSH